jgi:hypothetical protein
MGTNLVKGPSRLPCCTEIGHSMGGLPSSLHVPLVGSTSQADEMLAWSRPDI